MERINKAKIILWTILGFAGAVAVTRFLFGLGATTNLTDETPWGFWIGFDVMGGVALAAGGFVIAAFHYIFGKKSFHPIARAAILTAFLGYIAVAVGLLFDLGLPWNIWHMVIYWNPSSPLFEVGWCVMLYLTVLSLEFAPVVIEKYPNISILKKVYDFLYKIRIPLVILGIMLSTLHQSSLGSLFLAMPYKLHPLWYSPILPVIFFASAICLGLMMVMVESMTSSYLYKKPFEKHILDKLSKYAVYIIGFYAIFRFADILFRGAGVFLFEFTWESSLFWIEILLSIAIPLLIFGIIKLRNNPSILYFGALIGVIGVVFNRINVGGLTHLNNISEFGSFYFPSWMELAVSAGVVSAAMLVFFYFIENYKVWEERPQDPDDSPESKPKFSSFKVYLGSGKQPLRQKQTFGFVVAFAFSFAIISGNEIYSDGYISQQVVKARGGDTLFIDGNRNQMGVNFKHTFHQELGINCGTCHHLNTPGDIATGCFECHNEMYLPSDAFNHQWHASSKGANLTCFTCHDQNVSKGLDFRNNMGKIMQSCNTCHEDMIPSDSRTLELTNYITLSYTDAMHNMCITCHQESLETNPELKERNPNLALCGTCHTDYQGSTLENAIKPAIRRQNKWVVIPSLQ